MLDQLEADPVSRTIVAVARELQSASNKLSMANRNQSRDTILSGLFGDAVKGRRAAARLESGAILIRALERDVDRLRAELGAMLDALDTESRARQ